MRKRVNFSTYSVIVTILSITILAGVLFVVFSNPDSFLATRIGAVIIVLLFCLWGFSTHRSQSLLTATRCVWSVLCDAR